MSVGRRRAHSSWPKNVAIYNIILPLACFGRFGRRTKAQWYGGNVECEPREKFGNE